MNISASLVVYQNPTEELKALLDSLAASSCQAKLIVIDNSPTRALAPLFAAHDYLWTGENLGFGKAHNLAVQRATDSSLHLLLNPDVSFAADVIEKLADYMAQHSDIACCVPQVLYPDGQLQRLCKQLPTPLNLFARRFMPSWAERLDHDYELRDFDYRQPLEIPSASGCFMAIRTEAFRQAGGFDPRFFMYMEDVDLSRRLADTGRLVYYPGATIRHGFAKSSYKNRKLMLAHIRSACQYFNKWGWLLDTTRSRTNRKVRAAIAMLNNQSATSNTP